MTTELTVDPNWVLSRPDIGRWSKYEVTLAEQYGYKCVADSRRGFGWYKFKNGSRWVWYCAEFWQTANLLDGMYMGHKKFSSLEQALRRPVCY